jgi:hypothetical protein
MTEEIKVINARKIEKIRKDIDDALKNQSPYYHLGKSHLELTKLTLTRGIKRSLVLSKKIQKLLSKK